jgi:signal transduction histidine kinase
MDKKQVYLVSVCFLFLIMIHGFTFGQNRIKIDSITALNKTETNKEKLADNYNNLGFLYSHSDLDSAYLFIKKALDISEKANYKNGKAEAYYMLSYFDDRAGKLENAIENLKKAIEIYTELKDTSYLAGCYNNLGVLYSYGTDQKTSLEYFIKAMNMAEEINETFALSEAYANIASNYEFLKEYVSALKYYNKALEVDLKANNPHNIAFSYISVGSINLKLQRYESAHDSLMKAKEMFSLVDDNYRKTELYVNLADYFIETGQLDSASISIQTAKDLNNRENYSRLNADILTIEGDLLLKQKKYSESLDFYNKAIELYQNQHVHDVLYDIYLNKSTALSELGKHEKAYEILKLAQKLNEDLKPQEIAKTLGDFEHAEELKEEKAKLLLEQEILNQKSKNEVILIQAKLHRAIFSIAFLGAIIILIIYFYVVKRKHNSILEENYRIIQEQKTLLEENFLELKASEEKLIRLNATKDKFFSIIAHDLKNPFNVLIGLSDIVISDPEVRHSEDFEQIIDGIFTTAKSGYNLLDNLLKWARSQTGELEYKPTVVNMAEIVTLNITFFRESAKAKNIGIHNTIHDDIEVFADYNMVNFVVRNILNNAIKFSFLNGKIEITANQIDNDYIFSIQDYGIGMNKETEEKLFKIESTNPKPGTANEMGTGLGLIICKEFIEKNGGEIWVESQERKGSCFNFRLSGAHDKSQ